MAPASHHRFHVQPEDGTFPRFAFHDSVSALWQMWRKACAAGTYPFAEGAVADFDPIFSQLVATSGDDPSILHQPERFAEPFLDAGDRLVAAAEQADTDGDEAGASRLNLRAAAAYRIGRYPAVRSPRTAEAWRRQILAYQAGARRLDPPAHSVEVPFARADTSLGDRDAPVPAIWRAPAGPAPDGGWPVLILLSGLDGYRLDQTAITDVHVAQGMATLTIDIPGTADSPAAPGDPASSDRLVDSVLDWLLAEGEARRLRADRIILRGVSTGGYHAARAAHVHADRLFACVAHGGGCHHMFDPGWVAAQDAMEFPFGLVGALAWKFGFRDGDPADASARYAAEAQDRFSLVDSGVLSTPSTRLLAINGAEDSIFPVEDTLLMATEAPGVDLAVIGSRAHMGEPDATPIIASWLDRLLAGAS